MNIHDRFLNALVTTNFEPSLGTAKFFVRKYIEIIKTPNCTTLSQYYLLELIC